MSFFIGPRRQQLLAAWRDTASEHPTGPHYDVTPPTRSDRFRDHLAEFIENPSEDCFEELWTPDLVSAADEWVPSIVLNLWSDSIEDLATLFDTIRDADSYDPAWTDDVNLGLAIPEVYCLCDPERSLVCHRAVRGLRKFGVETDGSYRDVRTALAEFEEVYRTHTGHVTADTTSSIPVAAEIDQLFALVTAVEPDDIRAEATGPRGDLYTALEGYPGPDTDDRGPIEIDFGAATPVIDGHVAARKNGAYQDTTTEHWAGHHYESWKWDFASYITDELTSEYDVRDLSPSELEGFFDAFWANADAYTDTDTLSTPVPQYLLGSWGVRQFSDFESHCLAHPDEAATVLSSLFDEGEHLVDRLTRFHEFGSTANISNGNLLRVATTLLMGVYPDRYVNFQYERFDRFFSDCSSLEELEDGFDARQYYRIVLACRDLWDAMADDLPGPAMLEVHTLIRLYQDFKEQG